MTAPALLTLLISLVLGILLAHGLGPTVPAAVLLAGGFLLGLRLLGPSAAVPLAFLAAGFISGALHASRLDQSALAQLAGSGRPVVVEGSVASVPRVQSDRTVFELRVRRVVEPEPLAVDELVRVRMYDAPLLHRGERVRLRGTPLLPRSGAEFDERLFLRARQIAVVLRAEEVTTRGASGGVGGMVEAAARSLGRTAGHYLSGDRLGLVLGVVVGDTSRLSEQAVEGFRITGLAHILAVSGANVGLLLGMAVLLLRPLSMSRTYRAAILAALVLFYAAVTGGDASVLRAAAMALLGLLAWVLLRETDVMASLCAAALALLTYNPFYLWDIGFQLSFLATTGIVLGVPAVEAVFPRLASWWGRVVTVSLTAQLAVTPVLAYHFQQISLSSLAANVAAFPAVGPILGLGLLGWLTGAAFPTLAGLFYVLAGWLAGYVLWLNAWLAGLRGSAMGVASPPVWLIAAYYGLAVLGVWGLLEASRRQLVKVALFAAGLLTTALLWGQLANGLAPPRAEARFLDVGQGDAALVRTPGASLLVDAGPEHGPILRRLAASHVTGIDAVVISHPEADHAGGLPRVLTRYRVGRVFWSPGSLDTDFERALAAELRHAGVQVTEVGEGERWRIGRDLEVEVLAAAGEKARGNEAMLVTRVAGAGLTILFAGDLEAEGQEGMVDGGRSLESLILKVPHHGSRDAVSPRFIEEVTPKVAVISVGKDNPFGHPSDQMLALLRKGGVDTRRTDRSGTVVVRPTEKGLRVQGEK